MKAVVLGATGHIGNAVTREFLARGWKVTAASRRASDAANLANLKVVPAPGDADTPGQFDRWFAGHDLVVDAAAPYPTRLVGPTRRGRSGSGLAAAQRRSAALLDAVARHNARLVYVSSFTTLPHRREKLDRLRSRAVRGLHDYFAVKEAIETMVLGACKGGLRAVVVNPTTCLGPWDLKPREFAFVPQLLTEEVPAIMRHDLNVIDVRDVAVGIAHAVETELYGRPLLLSGHNVSFATLCQWICEIGGGAPPRLEIDSSLGVLAATSLEFGLALAGKRTPLPALATMLVGESYPVRRREWDLPQERRDLSLTIRDAIDWYRQLGYC